MFVAMSGGRPWNGWTGVSGWLQQHYKEQQTPVHIQSLPFPVSSSMGNLPSSGQSASKYIVLCFVTLATELHEI